jgi:hypothetical protein
MPTSVELRRQIVNEPCGRFAGTADVNRCNRLLTACRSRPYTHKSPKREPAPKTALAPEHERPVPVPFSEPGVNES